MRQRWLVVWSAQAEQREQAVLHKRVEKERQAAENAWRRRCRRAFASQEEAEATVEAQAKHYRCHRVEVHYRPVLHDEERGRPPAGAMPCRVGVCLEGALVAKAEAIAAARKRLGTFILATNELDERALPTEEMLWAYKGQGWDRSEVSAFSKTPGSLPIACF
ncbi:hypothetical protein [Rhodothermus marinus]|uniref:hypothetical protein n=1 Tax=Rhodothermus marinus TaxID=29549 RepID=UPI0001A30515|nr:hypothetical protein [Rhodothermus marinus]